MSYRSAFFVLLGVFVLHFSRILFYGEVIFPHDNSLEVGLPEKPNSTRISNRTFSDESSVFIPELANNLRSDRKGWLATWNPHVQLGRAAYQVSGLTRAYLITNALSRLTSDPFRLYTALVLFTIGLTGSFLLLFLRSLGLHPTAAVFSAMGLAFGTLTSYWLTFVMFLSAICWLTCLLWLVAEFTQRPSPLRALGLAFATYSLFMTAYPQMTILCLYITSAFALTRLAQVPRSRREKLQTMLALLGCAVAGALASLPVYLDLLFVAKDSARLGDVSDSFFLGVLPPCRSAREMASFLTTIFDWSWLANAIDPKYPLHFNGLSFTPIYGSLIWLSFILKNRRVLFWQLFLIACLAGTIFSGVYLFAVHHLGFGLSRIQLLSGGIVPGFVLSAFTVDAIFRGELRLTIRSAAWLLAPLVAESVVALLVWHRLPIDAVAVAATFLLVAALLGSIYWCSIPALIGVAVVSTFLYGRALILSRPLQTIHVSSKLVDAIKAHTPDGSRFAIADSEMKMQMPPNQEALFGLDSVNSYDSLSSRRYQELVGHWSALGIRTYGRHFKFLDIEWALGDQAFPFSNVRLILSTRPIATDQLTLAAEVNGIKLYETATAPIDLLQTRHFQVSNRGEAAIDALAGPANLQSHRVEVLSDFQKIEVTASPQETLLFVSQQYHRAWRATSHQRLLRTVTVNGFYQGIVLPPFTDEVELSFRPFILWSWVPQLLFVAAGVSLLLHARWRIRRHELCIGG
jgi:hypothetical protein